MDEDRSVTEGTREAEDVDAKMPHQPDAAPTAEEATLADEAAPSPAEQADVARHHEEMDRLGAEVRGEGQIT